jgi:four helix bundle protein
MTEIQNSKRYNLEDRTARFASDCRVFIKQISRTISNIEDCKQLARSSGSVPANYIEANEALSKKDFILRIKICRKEAKESALWLGLIDLETESLNIERGRLKQEAMELMKIFGAILRKSEIE